jgi:hypothetical protein
VIARAARNCYNHHAFITKPAGETMATTDSTQQHEAMFLQFVLSLLQSGMMQLGKVMNPMTKTIDKDLAGVQGTIELLTMLREKTRNNLSKAEADVLGSAISSLQLNYVDEMNAAKAAPTTDAAAKKE